MMRRMSLGVAGGLLGGVGVIAAGFAVAQTGHAAGRRAVSSTSVPRIVRFDIARYQRSLHALMPGGRETWRGSGGAILLTGTGQAVIGTSHASGGGTWVSYSTGGTLTGQGTYVVTSHGPWRSVGGNLEANIEDTISRPAWGRSGSLRLAIRLSDGRTGTLLLSSAAAAPVPTAPLPGVLMIGGRRYAETTTPGGQVIFHVIPVS